MTDATALPKSPPPGGGGEVGGRDGRFSKACRIDGTRSDRPMRRMLMAAFAASAFIPVPSADLAAASFDPRVVTFGAARDQIKSTPIENRPNRPLHVYGNSVRRRHHRGGMTQPQSAR
jgi:hypothetical protein